MPTEESSFPYVRFLLKFRMNPRNTAKLEAAGIRLIKRTAERQTEIESGHMAQKGEAHYKRHTRTDSTGATKGDSGRPIFGWDAKGTPYDAISLELTAIDLVKAGGILTDAHMVQKPEDRMSTLVLVFEPKGEPYVFSPEGRTLIDGFVDASYGHVHGFVNPDDTATINAAHLFTQPLTEAKDPRYLRFLPDLETGKVSFRCWKRHIAAAPVEAPVADANG